MKKIILLISILLVLTGCSNKNTLKDKSLIFGEDEVVCKYIFIYEDEDTLFRGFCIPSIYVKDNKGNEILLKDAFEKGLILVDDILDGMEIINTYENEDIELKDLNGKYNVFKCSKRNKDITSMEKNRIIISKADYEKGICDY